MHIAEISPFSNRFAIACFCCSFPPASTCLKPTVAAPKLTAKPQSTRPNSSRIKDSVSKPGPPYSAGISSPQSPISPIFLKTSIGNSDFSSCSGTTGASSFSRKLRIIPVISFCSFVINCHSILSSSLSDSFKLRPPFFKKTLLLLLHDLLSYRADIGILLHFP